MLVTAITFIVGFLAVIVLLACLRRFSKALKYTKQCGVFLVFEEYGGEKLPGTNRASNDFTGLRKEIRNEWVPAAVGSKSRVCSLDVGGMACGSAISELRARCSFGRKANRQERDDFRLHDGIRTRLESTWTGRKFIGSRKFSQVSRDRPAILGRTSRKFLRTPGRSI